MTIEDAQLLKFVRREIQKREFNSMALGVQIVSGKLTLDGSILPKRESPLTDVKHELDMLLKVLYREPKIKEISNGIRVITEIPNLDLDHKDAGTRGRVRH